MEVKATAKTVRIAPRKVRLVLDLVRGKDAKEAEAILKFTPNHAAEAVGKVLNQPLPMRSTIISWMNQNCTLKRAMPTRESP